MRNLLFSFLLVCINYNSFSQKIITFEKNEYDFGFINEENGKVFYNFEFKNTSSQNISIKEVQSSCGCTVTDWTKQEIEKSAKGFVKVEFDPLNRPGQFSKTVSVLLDSNSSVFVLTIKGVVISKKKDLLSNFPEKIGGLKFRSSTFAMDNMKTDRVYNQSFDVYNDTDTTITFTDSVITPSHVKIRFEPQKLVSKTFGKIKISYNPMEKNDYGFVIDRLIIGTDEKKEINKKNIVLSAMIEEYFPLMTAKELFLAPKIVFEKSELELGRVKSEEIQKIEYKFTNTGKKNLIIRRTKSSCICISAESSQKVIPPGESAIIKVDLDLKNKEGLQYKTISIFSNDPIAPHIQLVVKAYVVKN